MKKLIFIFLILLTLNSYSVGWNNNGAIIFTVNPTVIILNKMNMTNNNGEIIIKSNSTMIIDSNLTNNNGNIEVLGTSNVTVKKNVINYSTFNNKELSTTRVLGNFINYAFILNEAIIEMGE